MWQDYHYEMMHSVPNCLTTSQSFETSYFAPPSPLESSPPSSPFDFDLDLLPDEIVSPSNLDFSLSTPLSSSLQIEIELSNSKKSTSNIDSKSCQPLKTAFSPDCQVPNSPSSLSIDSGILSPMMFSPSSEDQASKPTGNGSYPSNTGSLCGHSQGHHAQQQRNVPSASPMSMSPSSPVYSPGARQQRRLSSTDSGKTSTSTGSVKSFGGSNILEGNESSMNQSAVNLQESLNEFARLQQKIRLEQEGLSSPDTQFQASSPASLTICRLPSTNTQSVLNTSSQVTNVLSSLAPYPHDMISPSSVGGGKIPSSFSLKSKLHATIKTEPRFEASDSQSQNTDVYSNKPTPLLRQVLEDKSFEQYGVKPMDFVIEPQSLDRMNKSLANPQAISVPEQGYVKQDVAGISNNPVISLAMDQVKKDILTTCEILSISPDPSCWSKSDIKNWMTWTQQQYNIPPFDFGLWATYTGAGFVRLNEDEFKQRIPQGGDRMFAQLDLWRSAALESSALPALSSDINVLSEGKKKHQETQAHHGLNTSPITVSHGVTMSRNTPQALVQTPPPLSILQSPQPYPLNSQSTSYKSSMCLDFEPIMEQSHSNKDSSAGSALGTQLPDISTLQSSALKGEKFDIYDVLNMLDTGNSSSIEQPKEIKKEPSGNSGPPRYPMFSQASTSLYDPIAISTTSSSTSLGNQSIASSYHPPTMRSPTQLVWSSSGLTNPTSGNLLITPSSLPSLQIINTSATVTSPHLEHLKQEHPVLSTHPLSHLLPPPYPGTVSKTTNIEVKSNNQQSFQPLQKTFISHNAAERTRDSIDEQDLDDEDMDDRMPATQARSLTPAVTISPVKNTVIVPNITGRTTTNIHLWQFIKELLLHPELHSSSIHWVDRETGIFKIVDSVRVATLWGKRKNRPAMNYDKLSRSLRQYYKKGIMKKTERTQRLVYQFCHPYHL